MLCQTMLMMGLATKAPEDRPPSIGHIDSTTHSVRCHWEDAEYAYKCDQVIPAIEEAWDTQVGILGWPAPLPDDDGILDIYVASTGSTGGAYAYGPYEDHNAEDGRMGTSAYISIHPEFDTLIRWTMLHEFNHVLQYGIDAAEARYIPWEGTATAAEYWSDNTLTPMPEYTSDFQATPFIGLLGDGWWLWDEYDLWSSYEYGAALWLRYLDAYYGDGAGSAGLDLWLAGAQDSWTNEPDFIDASGSVAGTDWASAWMDFSVERAHIGTDNTPEWAIDWSAPQFSIAVDASHDVSELPVAITPLYAPLQTGAVYAELTGLTAGEAFTISVDGPDTVRWGLLVADGPDGDWEETTRYSWTAQTESVVVGVVHLGSGTFDSDDPLERTDLILNIELGGDETESDETKPGGCACSAGTSSGTALWWGIAALIGLRRKERSSMGDTAT
jgi:hypothetical protein